MTCRRDKKVLFFWQPPDPAWRGLGNPTPPTHRRPMITGPGRPRFPVREEAMGESPRRRFLSAPFYGVEDARCGMALLRLPVLRYNDPAVFPPVDS